MFITRTLAGGALLGGVVALGTIAGAAALRDDRAADDAQLLAGQRTLLTGADAAALGCAANESALVQPFTFQGERGVNSQCVVVSSPWAASVPPTASATSAPSAAAVRTSLADVGPAAPRPRQGTVARQDGRTWKRTALIIGGSTATGAGVGGLIGGKKGALIGSAIGGGGSTIYEATKRR